MKWESKREVKEEETIGANCTNKYTYLRPFEREL